jgi:hypothetical protein
LGSLPWLAWLVLDVVRLLAGGCTYAQIGDRSASRRTR